MRAVLNVEGSPAVLASTMVATITVQTAREDAAFHIPVKILLPGGLSPACVGAVEAGCHRINLWALGSGFPAEGQRMT